MNINFRQGIISSQSLPRYLILNSNTVDFHAENSPTILNFADGNTNYLLTESKSINSAWTIPVGECWLYWDISKDSGTRTFGYTTLNPLQTVEPESPNVGQMFFDLSKMKCQEWTGQYWRDVIRVIAGHISSDGRLSTLPNGSQIGVSGSYVTDYIVFDNNLRPIKLYTANGIEFYTKSTIKNFKNDAKDSFTFARIVDANGIASQPITKHFCVTWTNYNTLGLADPNNLKPAIGLAERSVASGEIVSIVYSGFVTNTFDWNWSEPPYTPIFVGNNGTISTSFDISNSIQKIGYIVTPNTIYLDIDEKVLSY